MAASFLSPAKKSKREAALQRMRQRWSRKPRKKKAKLSRRARARVNAKNAAGSRPWARSPLTDIITGLKNGESVWLESNSKKVQGAARTAKRKVATRTAFKKGVKGVRVTAVKTKKKAAKKI